MERLLDTRGLPRFDAFDRAIEALAELRPGTSMRLVFDHEPLALYAFLEKNDYLYQVHCRSDRHYEIIVSEC